MDKKDKLFSWLSGLPRWIHVVASLLFILAFMGIGDLSDITEPIKLRFASSNIQENQSTILITSFRGDSDLTFTNELFDGLSDDGWPCLKIENSLIAEDVIESSDEKQAAEFEAASSYFDTHGGDLLIWGEISAAPSIARIVIYSKSNEDVSPVEIDVNFANEWVPQMTLALEDLLLKGFRVAASGRPTERYQDYLKRTEPLLDKTQNLADTGQKEIVRQRAAELVAEIENLRETARNAIRYRAGLRLVCPNGCTPIEREKADFCLVSASVSALGYTPDEAVRGYRSLRLRLESGYELRSRYRAANKYWKHCLKAEGLGLEHCRTNEPDCTIALDPFS